MSTAVCVNYKCGVTSLETKIFDTAIDNENNLADVGIHMKYSCCDVAGPVSKYKIVGAGLKLRVRDLDVHIIDIYNGYSCLYFLGEIIFRVAVGGLGIEGVGAWFGKSLIIGKRITCCC